MLDISFEEDNADADSSIYNIILNGVRDITSHCFLGKSGDWFCFLDNRDTYNELIEYSFRDVGKYMASLTRGIRFEKQQTGYVVNEGAIEFEPSTGADNLGFGIFIPMSTDEAILKVEIDQAVSRLLRLQSATEIMGLESLDNENLVTFSPFPMK